MNNDILRGDSHVDGDSKGDFESAAQPLFG